MGKPNRLYILDHGNMHCDLGWLIVQAGLTLATRDDPHLPRQWVECPTHTVLIDHPEGWILWDTTCPRDWETRWAVAGSQELFPYDGVRDDQLFENQLNALGVGIEDIRYVVLSHLHADHAGNARLFKDTGATMLCSKAEYEGAMGFDGPAQGVHIKSDYATLDWTTFDGDEEFVDGVTLVQAPGHTWGTCALKVDLADTGTMLFTSDAVYLKRAWGPPAVGSAVVHDSLAWLRSVEKLRAIAEKSDAKLVFGHDAEQTKTLRFAPHHYE